MDETEDILILRRIATYRRFLDRYRHDSSLTREYEQLLATALADFRLAKANRRRARQLHDVI